jgi:poly(hydroxyalkanoate) depolymerase family esterase
MCFLRHGSPILERRYAPQPGLGPRFALRSHGIALALGGALRTVRGAVAVFLLAATSQAMAGSTVEVTGFGSNPGNLRMFKHVPDGITASPPLIVVLHGCTQNARDYATASGWIQIAERLRVPLAMAEQKPSNNQNRCFNWFVRGDNRRGQGEALSIRQMVDKMREDHGIDSARVFVTGLSAGGAMASVMLATYPEVFAGGSVVAGLPYGCAGDPSPSQPTQALQCMSTGQPTSPLVGIPGSVPIVVPLPPAVCQLVPIQIPGCPQGDDDDGAQTSAAEWGDRVRRASSHTGPFPKVSIWHGSADRTVNPINAESSTLQWTNVHGLGSTPSAQDTVKGHPRQLFNDAAGNVVVETITVRRMAHGVPVDPGSGADQCGTATAFVLDADVCSSLHIAKFWGLVPN